MLTFKENIFEKRELNESSGVSAAEKKSFNEGYKDGYNKKPKKKKDDEWYRVGYDAGKEDMTLGFDANYWK